MVYGGLADGPVRDRIDRSLDVILDEAMRDLIVMQKPSCRAGGQGRLQRPGFESQQSGSVHLGYRKPDKSTLNWNSNPGVH